MRNAVIADDEELSVELVEYLIKRYELPLKVIGRSSAGDESLDMITKLKPDIVFIDINMPVLSGLEVMEKVRMSENSSAVDFVVITGYSYFQYAQLSLRLGAKDILLKPVEPEQFVETMERVLGYRYSDNQIFNKIVEYINYNYQENIELKECAEKYHTSPNYIARMFKKYYGISFITYLNSLRIKKAQELLRNTDLSIKEIAYKVGYNNLNYFYKIFKRNMEATPKDFKNGIAKS
ncbi:MULTISPECIES: response regulator transcription factor [Tissierellales]|jgi:YesN/AraC family two-component response regulator|uniref:Helix-turn-helix domain-containing protein n=1 Tax=Acidilutibacter cellobiosedens TaxID=2507161 RepID=A0A410QEX8_9FIRM|nr:MULTISPECIES: helix-turn-helix domain-containing protein [Tissierellales]MBE6081655.1 helix-turn-helix domain-containing protein [Tissierellaceae bacterium]QAT62459.1 helix-turn-helix domain-containing protein [Acidilutibacter cellobiosedens]SCL89010.1 putative response regulatory protein [Sporanaerobacter sp. PP17-6a]